MPPPVQTEIGKYRLLRKIATGGMAEVYLAQAAGPAGFQKTLVLKRILPHLAEDQAFVEMFLNEARLAALLNHPNIVQIFDLGQADGSYFIAMEYIDGPNLRALCRKAAEAGKAIPFEAAAKIISLACEGLGYAHDFSEGGQPLNLIHRDISPDNVLLSRTGAVKVVDFGIAKAANQGHITKTGTLKGKLAYMPPEQLRGKPLDRRADIFSLGVVLYELLAGMKPFDATSEIAAMQAILHEPPVPLDERRPECPAELVIIVERALEKDRENRFPDCRAMQKELEQFLISRRTSLGAFELAQLVADLVPPPVVHPTLPTPVPKPSDARPARSEPDEVATQVSRRSPGDGPAQPAEPEPDAAIPATAPPPRGPNGLVWSALGAGIVAAGAGAYFLLARPSTPTTPEPTPPVVATRPEPRAVPEQPKPEPVPEQPKPEPKPDPVPEQPKPETKPDPVPEQPKPEAKPEPKPDPVPDPKPEPKPEPKKPPKKDPKPRQPEKPTTVPTPEPTKPTGTQVAMVEEKKATLLVEAEPGCSVTLDGRPAGTTPVQLRALAPGEHTLLLTNKEKGLSRQLTVVLKDGEEKREKVKFVPGTLVFRVQPWAFVEVDGKPQGQTPLPDGVSVYEGEHRVRLHNPELKKEKVLQVQVKPGTKEVIKVNFLDE